MNDILTTHNYPDELKALDQWVLWQIEWSNKRLANVKVPYTIYPRIKAKTNSKTTWTSYPVIDLFKTSRNIGFVLSNDDPYVFIDLDKVILPDGTVLPEYQHYIDMAIKLNGFVEQSQSGKGYHIVVKGKIPAAQKREHVEIYATGRFIALTGKVMYCPDEIGNGQALLDILYIKKSKGTPTPVKTATTIVDAPKLKRIEFGLSGVVWATFDAIGDSSHGKPVVFTYKNKSYNYPTRSEAEAMIVIQCIVAGYDLEKVYSLFKQQQLDLNKGGSFAEETNKWQYIKQLYESGLRVYHNDPIRQEMQQLSAYSVPLNHTSKQQEATVRTVLNGLLEIAYRYRTDKPRASYRQLQMLGNIGSTRTVGNALAKLVEEGLITQLKSQSEWTANVYVLNMPMLLKHTHNQHTESVSLLHYLLNTKETMIYMAMVDAPLTTAGIAKKVARQPRTVNKVLAELKTRGFIDEQDDKYCVMPLNMVQFTSEIDYFLGERMTKIAAQRKLHDLRMEAHANG